MADNILPSASLTPSAAPVDRFVSPRRESTSDIDQLAQVLTSVNPKLQQVIDVQQQRHVQSEEAAGIVAASNVSPTVELNRNRGGWKALVDDVRKRDKENGTNVADTLVGASPHFQRGLVKAKAQRAGMGLSTHLQMAWQNDVGGIKSVDDPAAVQAWLEEQTAVYSEKAGVNNIDPLITADVFTPAITTAQQQLLGGHMRYRAEARVSEYTSNFAANVGALAIGMGGGSSSVNDFIARLTQRESGGDSTVINSEGYGGWLQFGQDRLDDYNREMGTNVTVAQFVKNEAMQEVINVWHINDIDKDIAKAGYLAQGWSLDGLRAVAHLGGTGGMHKFVARYGTAKPYNPKDAYGTHLSDYYNKFSGGGKAIQQQADEAVANGVAPDTVNKTIVSSIVEQAVTSGNPAVLDALDDISTGKGPLANVAWVREARRKALEKIEDDAWQAESREHTIQERERTENRRVMASTGYAAIMNDPSADHSSLIDQANAAGEGELARSFYNLQKQLQDDSRQINTDHEALIQMRNAIFMGDVHPEEIAGMIVEGTTAGLWNGQQGAALFDDLDRANEVSDFVRDPDVRNWINNVKAVVEERTGQKDILGNVLQSGKAIAIQAEAEMTEELLLFLEDNPEASKARVRQFVRLKAREILKKPEYNSPNQSAAPQRTQLDSDTVSPAEQAQGVADPIADYTMEQLEEIAATRGVTVDEFIARVRAAYGYVPSEN